MIRSYVKEKFGVGLLPLAVIEKDLENNELAMLRWKGPGITIQAQLLYAKKRPCTPAMEALMKETEHHARYRREQLGRAVGRSELYDL